MRLIDKDNFKMRIINEPYLLFWDSLVGGATGSLIVSPEEFTFALSVKKKNTYSMLQHLAPSER